MLLDGRSTDEPPVLHRVRAYVEVPPALNQALLRESAPHDRAVDRRRDLWPARVGKVPGNPDRLKDPLPRFQSPLEQVIAVWVCPLPTLARWSVRARAHARAGAAPPARPACPRAERLDLGELQRPKLVWAVGAPGVEL